MAWAISLESASRILTKICCLGCCMRQHGEESVEHLRLNLEDRVLTADVTCAVEQLLTFEAVQWFTA